MRNSNTVQEVGEVDMGQANLANSRLTRLIYHIGAQSEYLGRTRVHVLRNNDKYNTYDGWCALNPNTIEYNRPAMKVYGVEHMDSSYITNHGTPTIKCAASTTYKAWKDICEVAGIDPDNTDIDLIIPEVSLKFDNGTEDLISALQGTVDSLKRKEREE